MLAPPRRNEEVSAAFRPDRAANFSVCNVVASVLRLVAGCKLAMSEGVEHSVKGRDVLDEGAVNASALIVLGSFRAGVRITLFGKCFVNWC